VSRLSETLKPEYAAALRRIDVDGVPVQEYIPVGVRPVLAAWGEGSLWVTNAFSNNLSRIDL
jgi:hypothetical protein